MMPTYWLEKNAGRMLVTLSDVDKYLALSIYISMPDNQKEVMKAIEEHFIKDMWICESMLLNDKKCGEKVKNDLCAMFESAIQDEIDRYMAPAPQTVTDQLMLDAGHKASDF